MSRLHADCLPDGSVQLSVVGLAGELRPLTPDQNRFCLVALGIAVQDKPIELSTEFRPVIGTTTLDGEEVAKRLHWSEQRVRLIAAELAELGIVDDVRSDEPE